MACNQLFHNWLFDLRVNIQKLHVFQLLFVRAEDASEMNMCSVEKAAFLSLSLTRSPQTKIYYCYIICKTRISLMKSDNYWAIRWFVLYGVFIGQACSMLNALTFSCQHIAQQLDNGLAHNKHSCIFASNMYWHSNYEHKDQISLDRSRWVPFCVRRYWTCVCVWEFRISVGHHFKPFRQTKENAVIVSPVDNELKWQINNDVIRRFRCW